MVDSCVSLASPACAGLAVFGRATGWTIVVLLILVVLVIVAVVIGLDDDEIDATVARVTLLVAGLDHVARREDLLPLEDVGPSNARLANGLALVPSAHPWIHGDPSLARLVPVVRSCVLRHSLGSVVRATIAVPPRLYVQQHPVLTVVVRFPVTVGGHLVLPRHEASARTARPYVGERDVRVAEDASDRPANALGIVLMSVDALLGPVLVALVLVAGEGGGGDHEGDGDGEHDDQVHV